MEAANPGLAEQWPHYPPFRARW